MQNLPREQNGRLEFNITNRVSIRWQNGNKLMGLYGMVKLPFQLKAHFLWDGYQAFFVFMELNLGQGRKEEK